MPGFWLFRMDSLAIFALDNMFYSIYVYAGGGGNAIFYATYSMCANERPGIVR